MDGRLTRSKTQRRSAFQHLTVNTSGRPIRAVLKAETVSDIFGCINRIALLDNLKTQKTKEHWLFGHTPKGAQRKRISISPGVLQSSIAHTGRSIHDVENKIRNVLLKSHLDDGLLFTDTINAEQAYGRQYTAQDYSIMFCGVFIDPPGSSCQEMHEDVRMDRDPIWNIVVPLDFSTGSKVEVARSEFCGGNCSLDSNLMTDDRATAWDAGWPHQGLGNQSSETRTMLHIAVAPRWMFLSNIDSEPQKFVDAHHIADNPADALGTIKRAQYGTAADKHHGTISIEYNNQKPIHDEHGPMYPWIQRAKAAALTTSLCAN